MKKALALALGLALSCVASAAAQVTAIKAGHLVDPQAGTVLTNQVILIRDNKVEQVGSPQRRHFNQRQTLIGLGLNKIGRRRHVPDTPETRGMIRKVRHLVHVVADMK